MYYYLFNIHSRILSVQYTGSDFSNLQQYLLNKLSLINPGMIKSAFAGKSMINTCRYIKHEQIKYEHICAPKIMSSRTIHCETSGYIHIIRMFKPVCCLLSYLNKEYMYLCM